MGPCGLRVPTVSFRSPNSPAFQAVRQTSCVRRKNSALNRRLIRTSDGKGIDHFIDVYGNTIIGIVFEAAGH